MNAERSRHSERDLEALLRGIITVSEADNRTITGLALDSRQVRPGDLFCACGGQRTHGLAHLDKALQAGAAAVVWEPGPGQPNAVPAQSDPPVPMFAIDSLAHQIGVIADRFYGHPSAELRVIGITGTDGKTSCSQFIARGLSGVGQSCGVIGTLGYGLLDDLQPASHTTPDAVRLHGLLADLRTRGAQCVVIEVSSHALDQGRAGGVSFDIAVLTNLTRDHLDYHGSEAAYARAKQRLFEMPGLRHAVLNLDDAFGRRVAGLLPAAVDIVGYGFGDDRAALPSHGRWVAGSGLRLGPAGMEFRVDTPWGGGLVRSPLFGRFNASNLLAVLSVLLLTEMPFETACAQLEALRTVPGRMELFGDPAATGAMPLAIVDYAHTPGALQQVLQAVREHCRGRIWCVFGCGGDRDQGKRPLMGAAAERYADCVVVTNDNPRGEAPEQIIAGILAGIEDTGAVHVEPDRAAAIAYAIAAAAAGDIVVVAGKGHETSQTIGDQVLPFSDRREVERCLRERGV